VGVIAILHEKTISEQGNKFKDEIAWNGPFKAKTGTPGRERYSNLRGGIFMFSSKMITVD